MLLVIDVSVTIGSQVAVYPIRSSDLSSTVYERENVE